MRDNSLEPERALHDNWAMSTQPESVPVDASFEAATAPENRYIVDWLGNVEGLSVLDLGSGCGEAAVYFAKHGARVTAADLSPGMLGLVDKVASLHGVRVTTVETSAERLSFPDNQFDIVYAANLLHHVDKARCLDEVRRVLRPGGRATFCDPLKHNPIIKVYRWVAKDVRTPEERPLAITDLRLFRSRFSQVTYKTFWLTALWIFLRFFLVEHVSPSKERYWKKILVRVGPPGTPVPAPREDRPAGPRGSAVPQTLLLEPGGVLRQIGGDGRREADAYGQGIEQGVLAGRRGLPGAGRGDAILSP